MRCAWASIEASASSGSCRPIDCAVAGMNCAIPLGARARDRERVEVRLGHELRGQQRRGDVPALRGAGERLGVGAPARTTAGLAPSRRLAPRALRAEADGGRARVQREAVVPRLPRVALDEVKALGVGGQPAVGGRRAEVELGAEAVQRPPGRRDPLRVRMAGEQDGLLGVGAKAADDDERDAVAPRRRLHAIERPRDVRAHRLALALFERSAGTPPARPTTARRRRAARARPRRRRRRRLVRRRRPRSDREPRRARARARTCRRRGSSRGRRARRCGGRWRAPRADPAAR